MRLSGFHHRYYQGAAVIGAVALMSCAGQDTRSIAAPDAVNKAQVYDLYGPEVGFVSVGKWSGPPGTYTFQTTVTGGGDYQLGGDGTRVFSFSEPITDETGSIGYAYLQANETTWPGTTTAGVTVGEVQIPAGVKVDSIRVILNGVDQPALTGVTSVALNVGYTDIAFVEFFNGAVGTTPPPSALRQGCMAGYWRQLDHFDSWGPTGLSRSTSVGSQFANASLYRTAAGRQLSDFNLLEALYLKGSSRLVGAAKILLRTGTTALLNSKHPQIDYRRNSAFVVDLVNNALASGNRERILTTAVRLHNLNHARGGCPLD